MPDCIHQWQGDAEGVRCLLCGTRLTQDAFCAMLSTPAPESKKKGKGKKKDE